MKQKILLLQRRLNGENLIDEIEVDDSEYKNQKINDGPAILNLNEFLKHNHLDNHDSMIELSQVLKIPCEKFLKLTVAAEKDLGFVTMDASKNILHYLNIRLNKVAISFLQTQQGEAGIFNQIKECSDEED